MQELAAYLFLCSLLCMAIVTPLAMKLGARFGVLDVPGPRKVHSNPIPLVGGWAIFLTLSLVLWGHLLGGLAIRQAGLDTFMNEQLRYFVSSTPKLIAKVTPLYIGASGIFLLGLFDDLRGMSVRSRLVAQTIMATILAFMGFHPNLFFLPAPITFALGILWIVGITNAFNFLDGLDGLSAGVALVGTLALLTIMGITQQPDLIFFLATLSGTLLGFLRYNFQPAKVFLGSSGSLLLGYLMAVCTLQVTYTSGSTESWLIPLLTPVFVLAIPLYDTTSVVLIRLFENRSIAIGDQSHFHHRLMKLGFSHRQTVSFILLLSFSVALSAVRLVNASLMQSALILIQIISILSIIVLAERVSAKVRNELLKRKPADETSELVKTDVSGHL